MSRIQITGRTRRIHPAWLVPLILGALVPLFIVFSAVTFVVAVGAYLLWLGFLALIVVATLVFDRVRRNRTGRPAKPAGVQRAIT
jgi:tellurite resistance protein TehA-like permease